LPTDRPLPDAVVTYLNAAQSVHRQLQQVLTQAAGYALLVMTRRHRVALLDAPVVSAKAALSRVTVELEDLRIPAPARHHHHHMTAAAETVGRSLDALLGCLRPGADDGLRAALTRDLRAATDHLRAASRLLPGFELVDLSQACCAAHVGQPASMLMCQAVER
jgi:cellulase/cellobiase CelA1